MRKDLLERRAKRLAQQLQQKQEKQQYAQTLGIWKHGARLVSAGIKKTSIPKYTRLLIVKNRYKTAANHPDYIGVFVDIKDSDALELQHPLATLRSQFHADSNKICEVVEEFKEFVQ